MTHPIVFRPVIPLLLSFIPGIILGITHPGYWVPAVLAVVIAISLLVLNLVSKTGAVISPLMMFLLIGYLCIQPWAAPWLPRNHVTRFIGPDHWHIFGVVDEVTLREEGIKSFVLKNLSLQKTGDVSGPPFRVSGKIRVSSWEQIPMLYLGDTLSITARVRSPQNFNNPGGFDFQRYLAFQGIWATAYLSGKNLSILHREKVSSQVQKVAVLRQQFSRFIDEQFGKEGNLEKRAILKALIIGDRQEISEGLRDAFNRAGVSHILAISGLHIGIVAAAAFGLFSRILSCFPIFLQHAWTRKGAAFLSLFPIILYGVLSGMSPSTQRAVLMVGIFLFGYFFERDPEPFNTLAIAAFIILILDPTGLFSISFQLSFISVFWILFGMIKARPLWMGIRSPDSEGFFPWIRRWLISFILVSSFAVLGTLPVVMRYFNQVSLVSLVANIAVIPLVGFIGVPAGLIAVFLFPVYPGGAALFLKAGAAAIDAAISVVHIISPASFAALKTITPSMLEIALYYGLLWALLSLAGHREDISGASNHGVKEKEGLSVLKRFSGAHASQKRAMIVLCVLLVVSAADIAYWLHYRLWHNNLRVSILDVGQGSAALVEFPKGYNLLIDGGGFSDNAVFDVGASVVAPYLWRNKIMTLDAVVLSHPNSDHLNGLVYIAQNFRVKTIWKNSDIEDSRAYRTFSDVILERKIHTPSFETLSRFFRIHGVTLEILYPPPEYTELKQKDRWRNYNNNSLVIRIQAGDQVFLFPGDIMEKAERELEDLAGEKLRSTLMVAPHHGSKTSSTSEFLEAVHPRYVVVSTGRRGPHPEVLARYHRRGAKVYSTHVNGAIRILWEDGVLKIRRTRNDFSWQPEENRHGGLVPQMDEKAGQAWN